GAETDTPPVLADAHTNEERRLDALSVLWTLGKCLGAVLPVYLAGYYRVSTSLVAFGLVVYTGWRHTRDAKEARLRAAMRSLGAEEDHSAARGLSRGARDSPSWIGVPDVEKVEWLNKVLQQAWPFVGQYLEKLLVETIAPSIRASSTHLQTLSFTKIDMGSKAMKVVGIKAHTENDKGQVLLDVHISYVGDVEINVEIKRYFCKAGVKGIQLHGMMRVILEPLIGDVPIVGAVTMFFIRRPKLDINWTGLTNLLDIPGLNVMSDTMIMDAIASFLVLPNRLTVPLVPNLPVAQLRCPLPRGVVRIHLLEAENLAAKDNYVKGMISGMSDPYTIIRVGPQTFKSHHVDNSLSPKWGEMYEVIVHEVPGQELEVEVYDKDPDQDDFLGRTKVDLGMVKKARVLDEWFPLKDTSSGRVHLKMEWLCLLPSTEQLDQVIQRNKSVAASSKTTDPPSAAILVIYLDRAEALPMKKGNKEPSPMVQLSIQDVTRESRTCFGTTNPEWGDAFTFFIHDPRHMDIDIQVKDNDRVLSLGSLSIPLSRLLTSPDLSLDQWFQLENSEASSRISLHAVLRVLWLDEEGVLRTPLPWDAETFAEGPWSGPGMKAQKTSPNASFATEGVLRIHLVEARNLISKDKLMGGIVKGKSDPYVKTRVGGMTFRSNVIEENLNPTWNELYEVTHGFPRCRTPPYWGRLCLDWYKFISCCSAKILLDVTFILCVIQVLQFQSQHMYKNKAVPSAAVLFVYLERAHALPLKKSGKEPMAGAELILRGSTYKTKVCDRSTSPQWNEAFYFPVHNPKEDILVVKLSHNWTQSLGSLFFRVRELLSEPGLVLDQWLSIDGASVESQILLRAELKVNEQSLAQVTDPSLSGAGEYKKGIASAVASKEDRAEKKPLQTTPNPNFAKEGLLRIYLVEAQNLVAKDNLAGGMVKGKSDPYVKIQIGSVKLQSHVIKENLNPTWNELFEVTNILLEYSNRCSWYTLNDVKSGRVHLLLEWVSTVQDPVKLEEVLEFQCQHSYQNKVVPSAALLFVYLDRAHALPIKKSGKEPKVRADIELGETSYKTKVCDRSTSPQWDEAFYFLVHNPREDILKVKLFHTGDQPTGSLVLPVRELLVEPDLVLDRWLSLDGVPPESQILLRAELKILDSKINKEGDQRGRFFTPDSASPATEVEQTVTSPRETVNVPMRTGSTGMDLHGVLRIHLVKAQNLVAKDNLMGGMVKGKSDPYVKIQTGAVTFQSHVIKENLNPIWNELYEVVLNHQPGQEVQFELYDKDMDSDDFLGRLVLGHSGKCWYTLNDVKSGRVHLLLEWVSTVQDPAKLEEVLKFQCQHSYENKAVPSAAVLFVYLDRADSLPLKKSGKEPKVEAEVVLGGTSHKTNVCDRSTSPKWDEAFHFLVHKPREDILKVKLFHTGDQPTGSLILPVRELLKEPDLVLDRWLSLDGVPPESQILLRAELKVRLKYSTVMFTVSVYSSPFTIPDSTSAEEVEQTVTPPRQKISVPTQELKHKAELKDE
uniref:Extended synaptotagmin 1 n=1 Tax=Scleropages formosus TaxID=113540 RepID=A0A8C9TM65_SCLFO